MVLVRGLPGSPPRVNASPEFFELVRKGAESHALFAALVAVCMVLAFRFHRQ
jgi:hypothetical protein